MPVTYPAALSLQGVFFGWLLVGTENPAGTPLPSVYRRGQATVLAGKTGVSVPARAGLRATATIVNGRWGDSPHGCWLGSPKVDAAYRTVNPMTSPRWLPAMAVAGLVDGHFLRVILTSSRTAGLASRKTLWSPGPRHSHPARQLKRRHLDGLSL